MGRTRQGWRSGRTEAHSRCSAKGIEKEGRELEAPAYRYEELPPHGLSKSQLIANREELEDALSAMQDALALGDISAVEDHTA